MLRPNTFALTALLSLLTSFGPLSIDLLVPSMPAIGDALGVPFSRVQLTLSLYLAGFAVGQLAFGPISDRFGRKVVLIGALFIYAGASCICIAAPSIDVLIAGRMAQGIGASGALTIARAVVRDLHEGARAGHQLTVMSLIMSFVPMFVPFAGALMVTLLGWRIPFVALLAISLASCLLVWRLLPETAPPGAARPVRAMLSAYPMLLRHPLFVANLITGAVAYAGIFAWLAGSSYVFQQMFGFSPIDYALIYAAAFFGFTLGGLTATRLVMRIGLDRTAGFGAVALAVSAVFMIFAALDGRALPATLTIGSSIYLFGLGLLLSQLIAAALTPFPRQAGAASALIGFSQQCASAIMSAAVGYSLSSTVWPLVIGPAVTGFAALLLWVATQRMRTLASPQTL
jgi:DHA1 family bicyclomycin/chloramphenicol resistance-like MFS transporter